MNAQATESIVTWATPHQRAEKALELAGDALEFDQPAEALDYLRETIAHVDALVRFIRTGYRKRGQPDVRVTALFGPHPPEALRDGDLGTILPPGAGDPERLAEWDRAMGRSPCPGCSYSNGRHAIDCPDRV